jgi:uncharacterized membrane protein HdeD (DUF308 family)
VFFGSLSVVLGAVIAWPHESLTALSVVLGCRLIILGTIGLGAGRRSRRS